MLCRFSRVFARRASAWSSSSQTVDLPRAVYGGRHRVTLIPGDGIGPELMTCVKDVLRRAGCPMDFEEVLLDLEHSSQQDMESALLAIQRNGVALKGNLSTVEGGPSRNVELRARLNLFAYMQHCYSIPGVKTRHGSNLDLLIIRENTEGEYAQLEHQNVPGVVESLKVITRKRSKHIARFAFEEAAKRGRSKVTAVHKANIMKLADGLFLESCKEVSEDYPNIEFNDVIIDNCCMQLLSRPQQFDVMVMPNLYGNVVGNIAAGLVGGPGVVAGANLGTTFAIFETGTRGSGRAIRGMNIANPCGLLLGAADMLTYMGLAEEASHLRDAVHATLAAGVHTPDLGGQSTTSDVIQAVLERLHAS